MLQVVDFACGEYSSFALAQGGHVFAWGVNNYGQLAFPGKVSPPRTKQIASNSNMSYYCLTIWSRCQALSDVISILKPS